jgi:hypothetical protein
MMVAMNHSGAIVGADNKLPLNSSSNGELKWKL